MCLILQLLSSLSQENIIILLEEFQAFRVIHSCNYNHWDNFCLCILVVLITVTSLSSLAINTLIGCVPVIPLGIILVLVMYSCCMLALF